MNVILAKMKSLNSFLVIITLLFIGNVAISQSDKVLLTIADSPVSVEEFKSIYLKNTNPSNAVDQATLEDYLKLFINFKLKVHEAKSIKLDTSTAFRTEYQGYIKQLAQPYLTDSDIDDQLINEAYERLQYEISASHILINVPESASPADTLKIYKKALDARARVLKGEPFGVVAVSVSNDPSVARNSGYLGYFTAFQMVYPFETAAYNTPVDSISMPVRSRFGYHIIKVHTKRPALGQVKLAHIMIRVNKNATPQDLENARKQIVSIHERLKNGADFASIAKEESQDQGTSKNGGELPWLSSGQIIPEIDNVAFALATDGQISEPFQSTFGWHIVKRLGRKLVGTKDEMLPEIKLKITKDIRNLKSRESFILKLKNEYKFKEDTSKLAIVRSMLDSSLYKGEWRASQPKSNANLFSFAGGNYSISDFLKFIEQNQQFIGGNTPNGFIALLYREWVNRTVLEFEEAKLAEKHPDFKQLSKEYYEGMLLFEITNQIVWHKSSDSTGLAKFYETRSSNYAWGERVHYSTYTLTNANLKDKVVNAIVKGIKKNTSPLVAIEKINKNKEITVEEKVANPDFADVLNYKSWKDGINVTTNTNGQVVIVEIRDTTTGDLKRFEDCRGQVVADYQEELEREWISTLKTKYSVNVDQDVFTELIESFKR